MLVQAVERFRQAGLELNLQEIFVWYFEQKGVENAERFLGVDLGMNQGVSEEVNNNISPLPQGLPIQLLQTMAQNLQKENLGDTQSALNNELQNILNKDKEVE